MQTGLSEEPVPPPPQRRTRLCVSRRRGERVRLRLDTGEVMWFCITDVDRGKVRLMFDCPSRRRVEIVREELLPPSEWYVVTEGKRAERAEAAPHDEAQ